MTVNSKSKITSSENKEGRKINENLKMTQEDIDTNDCEAYGVAPSALASRMDYEHVY